MNLQFLSNTTLFRGLQTDEIRSVLTCMNAREKSYRKGEVLCRAGESVSSMGMILSGSVNIVVNYYWGGSNIFGHIGPGELFAESYAAIPGRELLADVIADEPTEVLFLPFLRLTETCAQSCPFHNRVIHNLLQIMARKNLHLSVRMMHTASRSIRNRLLSYLSEQAVQNGSSQFTIPFSRQQLADYLGVDRSALSNELSKMQRDGLITYKRNRFALTEKVPELFSLETKI